jgi:hypothetical protein
MSASPSRHEVALAERGERKGRGSYYTPPDVAGALLDLALAPLVAAAAERGPEAVAALRVVDPSCGAGNVLVAAARRVHAALVGLGVGDGDAWRAAARTVVGVDVDPIAARRCRAALREASGGVLGAREVAGRVVVADALGDPAPSVLRPGRFDAVVGNPPFLNQLDAATARGPAAAARLRGRFGDAVSAYTDPAALFLLLGLELARPDGGVVALVEPLSVLSARDAAGVRRRALEGAALEDLWALGERVFDASVEVCVPVLRRVGGPAPDPAPASAARHDGRAPASPGEGRATTRLWRGRRPHGLGAAPSPGPADRSWSALLADGAAVPRRRLGSAGVVGDLAVATADFRDHFYGLAPHVVDRAEVDDEAAWPPLVTSGLIDPLACRWGRCDARFNKVTYRHPRVDRRALPPALRAWADARLVAKVLVAAQTRVPEAVADPDGRLLPSVPVITVLPRGDDPDDLWRLAAVLAAPAVALEAVRRHAGSGLNARALRLRAADVAALPLPAHRAAWDEAADAVRAGAAAPAVAGAMGRAYGLGDDPELVAWWGAHLPVPR